MSNVEETYELPDGTKVQVASNELALFFNMNTIRYGWSLLDRDMTPDEARLALINGGFQDEIADAFLKRMQNAMNIFWVNGRLMRIGDQ